MPYARPRKYAGPLQPGKRSAYVPGTRRNAPRRYTKPYTRRVPVSTKRATQINIKKIRKLESAVNGKLQTGYHVCRIPYLPSPGGFVWRPKTPLALVLNDFYSQTSGPNGGSGAIYYPAYFGAAPNITMGASIVDRWSDYKPGQNFGHDPKYWQWKDVENSQPSLNGYQPVYSDIRVCINRESCTPAQGDIWIRVDLVKAKRTFVPSNSIVDPHIFNMPTALGAFSNMAVPLYQDGRNRYNVKLWSVKTRWLKLPAVRTEQKNLQKIFHIRTKFPKTFYRLNNNVTSGGVAEEFWNLVPASGPLAPQWAILSISTEMVDADNSVPQINLTRMVRYRDEEGNGQ